MTNLMQSEVFFFISSIGFIILWVLIAVFMFYLIRFMKGLEKMRETIEKGATHLSEGFEDLVDDMLNSAFFRFIFGKRRKRRQ